MSSTTIKERGVRVEERGEDFDRKLHRASSHLRKRVRSLPPQLRQAVAKVAARSKDFELAEAALTSSERFVALTIEEGGEHDA